MSHRTVSLLLSLVVLPLALLWLAGYTVAAAAAPSRATQPAPAPKPAAEVQALLDQGDKAAQAYRWPEAETLYRQALEKAQALQDRPGEAEALGSLGSVDEETGQRQKALEYYQQVLTLARQTADRGAEATILSNMGLIYAHMGQSEKALEYYQPALKLSHQMADRAGEAITLSNIGGVYADTAQPQQALEYYRQALPLLHQARDKVKEATLLNNIGLVYADTARPREALGYYKKALALLRQVRDKDGQANTLHNIGGIYADTAQPQQALENYRQALMLRRQVGDRGGEATTLNNIGFVYAGAARPQTALEYYRQALAILQQVGDRGDEATALSNIGVVYDNARQPRTALGYFERAVARCEALRESLGGVAEAKASLLGSRLGSYYAYLSLLLRMHQAEAAFAVAQKTKARSLLDLLQGGQVDLLAALTREEQQQLQALRGRADLLNRIMIQESVESAVGARRRYVATAQQLRQVEADRQRLSDTLYSRHPELARHRSAHTATLADLGRLPPADSALLEYVVIPGYKHLPRQAWLFVVARAGAKPTLHSYRLAPQQEALATECAALRAACADPRREWRLRARQLYRRLVGPAERELAGKRRLIICPDGALWDVPFQALLAAHGQPLLARFEIVYAYSATGALAAAAEAAERRRARPAQPVLAVANPAFGAAARFADLEKLTLLVAPRPRQPQRRPIDRPSRPLDRPSRSLQRLGRSGQSHGRTRRRRSAHRRPRAAPSRTRAIDRPSRGIEPPVTDRLPRRGTLPAPPVPSMPTAAVGEGRSNASASLARGGQIEPLPGTQREADALRRLFPGAAIYTGPAAQEATVKQQAGHFRYLHFATHSVLNDSAPLLSSIVLAQPPPGSPEDGVLTAREIFDLKLNAELAVLSACDTARGEVRRGEGMIGLTWALLVAGCPAAVVSQWSVNDASTALLMAAFYRRLAGGEAKGEALRAAALALRRQRQYQHPYYWAPFVLVGDWH